MKRRRSAGLLLTAILLLAISSLYAVEQSPLLTAMKTELDRSVKTLAHADSVPMYFLSYQVTDTDRRTISASYGAIGTDDHSRTRILDIDLRYGDYRLDNTREIRGSNDYGSFYGGYTMLPLQDDEKAIRTAIWEATDNECKAALEQYTKVKTNQNVMVEQEDTSADFSIEKPNVFVGSTVAVTCDTAAWETRLRELSALFKDYPFVQNSSINMSITNDNRYFVSSEGSSIQQGKSYVRLSVTCSGTCSDGMQIQRYDGFDAATIEGLPADSVVVKTIHRLVGELEVLLKAPLAEPYSGPAILVNRAAGVYFHEIFGHRIEGHRQKSESEGQTFAKKVNQKILPDFISVIDDPTLSEFKGEFLRGHYLYDDEGVKTEKVTVVDNGVLRNFLMSRSPVRGFPVSNAHGRKQAGRSVVSRQGNLMVRSTKELPFDSLLAQLKEECRKQGKPYGLIFYDISGGFTSTGRSGPQAFKVIPLLVYKYYTDGRPMEAIRGVDIVGTPLASFEQIIATGNDYDTFNGTCGAESGMVPVSAIAPSVLVASMEVEKKFKEQQKPPILPPPYKPIKTSGIY
jgi:predicted Zn-dependent protease